MKEYLSYLERAWNSGWITNNGELARELEKKLEDYLEVNHVLFVTNGTIAIQLALRVLEISKEVITTPYSYVATTNSILWEGARPVFADIHPVSYCLDPEKMEALITNDTQAILGTHVYGIPCDVAAIEELAQRHGLKTIYDAAHAFGVRLNGRSVVSYGDVSTLSFHATKLFHTVEGGAIVTNDGELYKKLRLLRSFGHVNDDYFSLGINGKNSEFHAAMGLAILPKIGELISERKKLFGLYENALRGVPVDLLQINNKLLEWNYSYFPVFFESHEKAMEVKAGLEAAEIFPRRYFFPSLNDLPHFKGECCPVSESAVGRVLALPFFNGLSVTDVKRVVSVMKKYL
jgi:dTDP-4-amino-4,6-dideoxygalactose transaminase